MTTTAPETAMPRRSNALGVHSLDRFGFSVPDIDEAARFYEAFGLDVRRDGARLELRTMGNPHCWGVVHADGKPRRLQYLSFSTYDDDFEKLARRIGDRRGDPHPLADRNGIWVRDPDGTPVRIHAGPKVSASAKAPPPRMAEVPPGKGAAPARSKAAPVRPRRLSHVLLFTPDVPRQIAFYTETLGLRLSDRSGDVWKVVSILREYRPDLRIKIVATAPSGLCVVRGLDPASRVLGDRLDEIVERYRERPYPAPALQTPEGFELVPANEQGLRAALQ